MRLTKRLLQEIANEQPPESIGIWVESRKSGVGSLKRPALCNFQVSFAIGWIFLKGDRQQLF